MSVAALDPYKTTLAGVALTCMSTSIGGATVVMVRMIIEQTDPFSLVAARFSLASLVLLGCVMLSSVRLRFDRADLLPLVLLGLLMFTVFNGLLARALQDTTAGRGGLLFAAQPIITIVIAVAFRVEQLSWAKALGVAAAVAGGAVALGENVDVIAPNALRGDAFMFGAMLAAAIFNVFAKRYLMKYGSLPVMVFAMCVGAAGMWVLALIFGAPFGGSLDFDAQGWLILVLLGLPGGALMIWSWGRGLSLITPTQATITIGFNPLTAILLGAWLLSEPISVRLFIGFILILSAIVLANLDHVRTPPVAQP